MALAIVKYSAAAAVAVVAFVIPSLCSVGCLPPSWSSWFWLRSTPVTAIAAGETERHPESSLEWGIQYGRPVVVSFEALGAERLKAWTPDFLTAASKVLYNVSYQTERPVAAAADPEGPARRPGDFVHYTDLALGPFLAQPWTPPRPGDEAELPTEVFFKSCREHPDKKTRWYYYSSRADVSPGVIHADLGPMVARFREALPTESALPSDSPDCNVWLSCAGTGSGSHYDLAHGLILQTHGTKQFDLYPPRCLADVTIPPTSHPYARQILEATPSGCWSDSWAAVREQFLLGPGEALYIPPLYFHSTSCLHGACVSVNNFVRNVASEVAEALQESPLPFEGDWPESFLEGAVLQYLVWFLGSFASPNFDTEALLKLSQRRWSAVHLRDALPPSCATTNFVETADETTKKRIFRRARDAANLVIRRLPEKFHVFLALDYVDDVLTGLFGPVKATLLGQICLPHVKSSSFGGGDDSP